MIPNENIKMDILQDDERLIILQTVRNLNLPDCWIGAGFVRNLIWDLQHCIRTPLNEFDIDVLYFSNDKENATLDRAIESKLMNLLPKYIWSVKNQARMHIRNGDLPYRNTSHAIEHWPETSTAIIVRLTYNDTLELQAPFGLDDAYNLILKPTPHFKNKMLIYSKRISEKNWINKWPKLKLEN